MIIFCSVNVPKCSFFYAIVNTQSLVLICCVFFPIVWQNPIMFKKEGNFRMNLTYLKKKIYIYMSKEINHENCFVGQWHVRVLGHN